MIGILHYDINLFEPIINDLAWVVIWWTVLRQRRRAIAWSTRNIQFHFQIVIKVCQFEHQLFDTYFSYLFLSSNLCFSLIIQKGIFHKTIPWIRSKIVSLVNFGSLLLFAILTTGVRKDEFLWLQRHEIIANIFSSGVFCWLSNKKPACKLDSRFAPLESEGEWGVIDNKSRWVITWIVSITDTEPLSLSLKWPLISLIVIAWW